MDTNLRGNDPGQLGHSLANLTEVLIPLLDAVAARSVMEIGSYAGDLTRELCNWAVGAGASVTAIDPAPRNGLIELSEQRPELELLRETSHHALRRVSLPDVVIIDGDHNYYTVREELRLIDERTRGAEAPLLIFHDVCWPHGRRDAYDDPEQIPPERRESMVRNARVFPGEPGIAQGGLSYPWAAAREGGPRNGVLTAIEDFVKDRDGVRLAIVPAFFGFGVVWPRDAPWASAVAGIVEPWSDNAILARLEANRVLHLAKEHLRVAEVLLWTMRSKDLERRNADLERRNADLERRNADLERRNTDLERRDTDPS
jgi:Methyltransferase domain